MKKIGFTIIIVSAIWIAMLAYFSGIVHERGIKKGATKTEGVRLAISQTRFCHYENNVIAGADFIEAALEFATHAGGEIDPPIDSKAFDRALDLHLDAYLKSYERCFVTGGETGHTILGRVGTGTFRIFRHRDFKRAFPKGTPSETVILSLIEYVKDLVEYRHKQP